MAKRTARRRVKTSTAGRKRTSAGRSAKRPTTKASARAGTSKSAVGKAGARNIAPRKAVARAGRHGKASRIDRVRRTLDETIPTPPSSLNMDRHSSAARSGRADMADTLSEHRNMSPEITGGDVDVDIADAYFTGEESPGGDNPTPDQDIVDDIGKALGIEYQDNEELKSSDKVIERDRHRWELDPASSEDYKDRK